MIMFTKVEIENQFSSKQLLMVNSADGEEYFDDFFFNDQQI